LYRDATVRSGRSEDISAGGLLVVLDSAGRADELVRARFALPSTGKPVELTAVIKWVKEFRGHAALGLEFQELPSDVSLGIERYIALMQDL
jgi:c-di-GMP-binding flagellar brake protein YcgR